MIPLANSFYADWRTRHGFEAVLRDAPATPPERLLQAIWLHQRLRRDQLRTLDGQSIRVLHPGFANVEGGPDFRGAVLQFGEAASVTGDVEVDLRTSGWRAHGHHQNPAFQNVVLHVVWDADRNASGTATLALRSVLDAPLAELSSQLEPVSLRTLPENLRGQCAAPLRDLPEAALAELLHQAAQVRLQNKAAALRSRAQHVGWEQSLWEGLFRALGYKHNVWPMQCLAELRPRWAPGADSPLTLQARLLGLSGLLPAELSRRPAGADDYLRRIWDCWWREREEFADATLPRILWRFHGLRPANHPQRRLALAAHWLHAGDLVARIERWSGAVLLDKQLLDSLMNLLQVLDDDYWSWHWTFRSARLKKVQPLLGAQRVTELAVNIILPWLWTRSVAGKNEKLRAEIEKRHAVWPAAEDNATLRLARQRLLGRSAVRGGGGRTAIEQQGLLQIVRDFCDHTDAACGGCRFPALVRNWKAQYQSPTDADR
ncbi:MAG: DUF2851 family protein [Verrucomicrobia bacterium]|nr:DUF2851 family protein [Verrucomicrobiota bacterium]